MLGGDFFRWERRERLVQQVEFEFSDGQEQRLRRLDRCFGHFAGALADDVLQQFGAEGRFNRFIEGHWLVAARCRCVITQLIGQGPGKKILPQVTDAAQRLGVTQAVIAVRGDNAYRCGLNV
nr:hypothetical protein GCM10020185_17110 [Pseudomonas brassicacearum subsp. brassicacearum]